MIVADLIAALADLAPDMPVVISTYTGPHGDGPADCVQYDVAEVYVDDEESEVQVCAVYEPAAAHEPKLGRN